MNSRCLLYWTILFQIIYFGFSIIGIYNQYLVHESCNGKTIKYTRDGYDYRLEDFELTQRFFVIIEALSFLMYITLIVLSVYFAHKIGKEFDEIFLKNYSASIAGGIFLVIVCMFFITNLMNVKVDSYNCGKNFKDVLKILLFNSTLGLCSLLHLLFVFLSRDFDKNW